MNVGILRDYTPDAGGLPRPPRDEIVRTAWRHAESMGNHGPPVQSIRLVEMVMPPSSGGEVTA